MNTFDLVVRIVCTTLLACALLTVVTVKAREAWRTRSLPRTTRVHARRSRRHGIA